MMASPETSVIFSEIICAAQRLADRRREIGSE